MTDEDAPISRRLRITGRVQGIGYRDALCRAAERAGVEGWVRNLADGSVEARARGPARAVDALITWARRGPPAARVAGVEIEDALPDETATRGRFLRRPNA